MSVRLPRNRAAARTLITCFMGCSCAVSCGLGSVMFVPYHKAGAVQKENDQSNAQLLKLQLQLQRMRVEAHQMQSETGRELEARRMGYLAPGEVPLVLVENPSKP